MVALAVMAQFGCNGLDRLPEDEGSDIPPTVDAALTRSCAVDGACHVAGGQSPTLGGAELDALVAGGYVRFGDLSGSIITARMLGIGNAGSIMPPASHPADAEDLGLIIGWIAGLEVGDEATTGEVTTGSEPTGAEDCLQGGSPAMPPTFDDLWPMFEVSCSSEICHGGSTLPQMPDADSAYAALVDVPSSVGPNYVTPSEPGDSYLWHKLVGTQASVGGGGGQMPSGSTLCGEGLIAVNAWIVGGAQR